MVTSTAEYRPLALLTVLRRALPVGPVKLYAWQPAENGRKTGLWKRGGMGNTLLTEVGVIPRWCSPQSTLYYILSPFSLPSFYSFPLCPNFFLSSTNFPLLGSLDTLVFSVVPVQGGIIENYFRPFLYIIRLNIFFLSLFFFYLCASFQEIVSYLYIHSVSFQLQYLD